MTSCAIAIPIYKNELQPLEKFSVDYSLRQLKQGRQVCFIAPGKLDTSYYAREFADVPVLRFEDQFFESVEGYSRLLLNQGFYSLFAKQFEFTLILQTDAILLRDEIDYWCGQPWDYIGAPWPDGLEVMINMDCFSGPLGKQVRAYVGNGGLSLRRNKSCMQLLDEFPQARDMFLRTGSSEDIFFGLLGTQSVSFRTPNERVASLFALELQPERYFAINQNQAPMGGHAWWRYNHPFWATLLSEQPPEVLPAAPPGKPVLSTTILA